MFDTSRSVAFVTLAVFAASLYYCLIQARRGTRFYLRRIPGLDAVDECVGRAAEMGRPIHMTPGYGGLTGSGAPLTIAGLEVQSYLARQCATYDVRLIISVAYPEVLPVSQEVQRAGHIAAGRPETYREEDVRFLSSSQFAFASAIIGTIEREKCVANIMVGSFAAEAIFLAENSAQLGCITIGGCTNLYQLPFFIAACDYTLIGEEIFAGSAHFSQDPEKIAVLRAQDMGKLALLLTLFVAVVTALAGSQELLKLLRQ